MGTFCGGCVYVCVYVCCVYDFFAFCAPLHDHGLGSRELDRNPLLQRFCLASMPWCYSWSFALDLLCVAEKLPFLIDG